MSKQLGATAALALLLLYGCSGKGVANGPGANEGRGGALQQSGDAGAPDYYTPVGQGGAGHGGTSVGGKGPVGGQGGTQQGGTQQGGTQQGGTQQGGGAGSDEAGAGGEGGVSDGGAPGAGAGGESGRGDAGAGGYGDQSGAGGEVTSGSGGQPSADPYCTNHLKEPLPYTLNSGFVWTDLEGDAAHLAFTSIEGLCAQRLPNAVGYCVQIKYAPAPRGEAKVRWSRVWDEFYTHPPVCLADGAMKVTFAARGAAGGEIITVSAVGQGDQQLTLTNTWQSYFVSVPVNPHTDSSGLEDPLAVRITSASTFAIDDVQYVK